MAQATGDLKAYTSAVSQMRTTDRISALQQFVTATHDPRLVVDALQLLCWDQLRTSGPALAANAARQLLNVDPNNSLAYAVLSDARASQAGPQSLDMALRGINDIEGLRKPEGMPQSEFATLKQQITAMLYGAAGLGELEIQDYVTARGYLHQAVVFYPQNAQYAYALGVADLSGANPNSAEGFWYLARAVNLTRGSPASQQISDYARSKYVEAGGTASQWDQFIYAAVTPRMPQTFASASRTASTPSAASARPADVRERVSKRPSVATKSQPAKPAGQTTAKRSTTTTASATKPKPSDSRTAKREREEDEEAALTKLPEINAPRPKPLPPRPHVAPGSPVSLGIIIGSYSGGKADRQGIINGLSEVLRHLRVGDEAFIMSYSNQLDFEQDLTGNYRLLEQAMDHIQPHSGTALYDAVNFASGHLKRIAKNQNRVLLVISDGKNSESHSSPLEVAANIREVKIFCIGVDVDSAERRTLLTALAAQTGGQASFISDPRQFREATMDLAQNLGIGGPF